MTPSPLGNKAVKKAGELIIYKDYTLDEHMGANAVHEATHVLDPESKRSYYKNPGLSKDIIREKSEFNPVKNEMSHYKQLSKKR